MATPACTTADLRSSSPALRYRGFYSLRNSLESRARVTTDRMNQREACASFDRNTRREPCGSESIGDTGISDEKRQDRNRPHILTSPRQARDWERHQSEIKRSGSTWCELSRHSSKTLKNTRPSYRATERILQHLTCAIVSPHFNTTVSFSHRPTVSQEQFWSPDDSCGSNIIVQSCFASASGGSTRQDSVPKVSCNSSHV